MVSSPFSTAEPSLKEVKDWYVKRLGPPQHQTYSHWTDSLPKTRSGKIMRRISRKIATGDTGNLRRYVDTGSRPSVVDKLHLQKAELA